MQDKRIRRAFAGQGQIGFLEMCIRDRYCDQVFFAVICADQLFIKITPEVAARMPDCPKAPAYPGAKESFLMEDLDDRERLAQIVRATCDALSKPKTRRAKTAKSE